jgi:hypothetical protein
MVKVKLVKIKLDEAGSKGLIEAKKRVMPGWTMAICNYILINTS